MTIKIPEKNFADKLLALFGKRRGILIPFDPYKDFGPYVISVAKRENFWKALFRGKNKPLPKGIIDGNSYAKQEDYLEPH